MYRLLYWVLIYCDRNDRKLQNEVINNDKIIINIEIVNIY